MYIMIANFITEASLKKSGQLSLRMNIIRVLSIEIYKCVKGIKPIMTFVINIAWNNQNLTQRHFGAKLWNLLPSHLQSIDDLHVFKSNLYKWCLMEYVGE